MYSLWVPRWNLFHRMNLVFESMYVSISFFCCFVIIVFSQLLDWYVPWESHAEVSHLVLVPGFLQVNRVFDLELV